MVVSEVNITPIKPVDGLVAFASCVIDGELYIGSIGVHKMLDGSGYRITYPTKKVGVRQLNYFYPITKDAGRQIEQAIVAKCMELFERSDEQNGRHSKTAHNRT
jgi:DNA-binding cell septation regulator SpoVG